MRVQDDCADVNDTVIQDTSTSRLTFRREHVTEEPRELARDAVVADLLGDGGLLCTPASLPSRTVPRPVGRSRVVKGRGGVVLEDLRAKPGRLLAQLFAPRRFVALSEKKRLHDGDVENRLQTRKGRLVCVGSMFCFVWAVGGGWTATVAVWKVVSARRMRAAARGCGSEACVRV